MAVYGGCGRGYEVRRSSLCCAVKFKCSSPRSSLEERSQYDTLGLVLALRSPATVGSAVAAASSNAVVAGHACSASLFVSVRVTARTLVSLSAQLPDYIEKGFLDIDTILGGCFDKIAAQVLC